MDEGTQHAVKTIRMFVDVAVLGRFSGCLKRRPDRVTTLLLFPAINCIFPGNRAFS